MKKEFEVISKIIQNNKRVLDVGCGDGTLMEYLKKKQQTSFRCWMWRRHSNGIPKGKTKK